MLDPHPDQLIAAKAAPETEQDQGAIASMAQFIRGIAAFRACGRDCRVQPVLHLR